MADMTPAQAAEKLAQALEKMPAPSGVSGDIALQLLLDQLRFELRKIDGHEEFEVCFFRDGTLPASGLLAIWIHSSNPDGKPGYEKVILQIQDARVVKHFTAQNWAI